MISLFSVRQRQKNVKGWTDGWMVCSCSCQSAFLPFWWMHVWDVTSLLPQTAYVLASPHGWLGKRREMCISGTLAPETMTTKTKAPPPLPSPAAFLARIADDDAGGIFFSGEKTSQSVTIFDIERRRRLWRVGSGREERRKKERFTRGGFQAKLWSELTTDDVKREKNKSQMGRRERKNGWKVIASYFLCQSSKDIIPFPGK